MHTELQRVRTSFDESLKSVHELLGFDGIILSFALAQVRHLKEQMDAQRFKNPYVSVDPAITALENIHKNGSFEKKYSRVFNQCLVLLVSHFGSTIRDSFEVSVDLALDLEGFDELRKATVELTLAELRDEANRERSLGEILTSQEDISFQDMKSIARAFESYFHIKIPKDVDVHNIILAQACRHAIVHSGAVVDRRLLGQVSGASPRTVKPGLLIETEIFFERAEVETIGESMKRYLNSVLTALDTRFGAA